MNSGPEHGGLSDAGLPVIALTTGEPAGIGPDICLALAAGPVAARLVALGDPAVLAARAELIGATVRVTTLSDAAEAGPHVPGRLQCLPVPAAAPVHPGRLDPANARYVVTTLARAAALCISGTAAAVVTAPVQKSVINEAGIDFSGHTEYFAEATGSPLPVMMLATPGLRVALATTHLPLRSVPDAIRSERLEPLIRIIDHDLRTTFGIAAPRILVLGLNPHAGENGVLGTEEIETIRPVVAKLAAEGIGAIGPVSADTAFTTASLSRADIVLAMYHDQGLPVIKAAGFGDIVNVTLGLPIIRTSVDHGTALDLAGTGRASHRSLTAATLLAIELAGKSGPATR